MCFAQGKTIVDFSTPKTTTKYLPKGAKWYDFWTNRLYKGGQDVTLETYFDRVPMFVREGSIIPIGLEMQYTGEKSWHQSTHTLTIGTRQGNYPGMLQKRSFNVILPDGEQQRIEYTGKQTSLRL